jgi:murein L,D-transpeptidase YcbB/YkuD
MTIMRIILASLALMVATTGCGQSAAPSSSVNRLWSGEALTELKRAAEAAPGEGLPTEKASLDEIDRFERLAATDPAAGAQLDIAADVLFSGLARSFAQGATDPAHADPEWRIPSPAPPDLTAMRKALSAGASPAVLLQALLPETADYGALRAALAQTYAEAPGTLDANGLDRETRLLKLRANMERWRWLPREMATPRIEVRLAQFEVILLRRDMPPVVHAAIVGSRKTPTPSFMAKITSVTLNPAWQPPSSILKELLPRFRRDPGSAERQGFEAIGSNGETIPPALIDWNQQPFPYGLRQRPGPQNALGKVRFNLPNPFSIYLHDTSNTNLFAQTDRALSHGCIRVRNPDGLAEAMLAPTKDDIAALKSALADSQTKTLPLRAPTPVYVMYLTASAREDGAISFFEDLYRRDDAVVAALDAPETKLVAAARPLPQRCEG